jgi:D-alanyl-D-alanine carboxypeptidase
MAMYILKAYPEISRVTTMLEINLKSESGFMHNFKNTDILVEKIPNLLFSKTGFTDVAGGSLAIIFKNKNGHDIAVTILGSTFDGRFIDMENIVNVLYSI